MNTSNQGTIQSLEEAVQRGMQEWNAYLEFTDSRVIEGPQGKKPADFIQPYIKEFEAQKFQITIIEDHTSIGQALKKLFRKIHE